MEIGQVALVDEVVAYPGRERGREGGKGREGEGEGEGGSEREREGEGERERGRERGREGERGREYVFLMYYSFLKILQT